MKIKSKTKPVAKPATKPNPASRHKAKIKRTARKRKREATVIKLSNTGGVLSDADLFQVLLRVKNGNFAVRLPADQVGIKGKIIV